MAMLFLQKIPNGDSKNGSRSATLHRSFFSKAIQGDKAFAICKQSNKKTRTYDPQWDKKATTFQLENLKIIGFLAEIVIFCY